MVRHGLLHRCRGNGYDATPLLLEHLRNHFLGDLDGPPELILIGLLPPFLFSFVERRPQRIGCSSRVQDEDVGAVECSVHRVGEALYISGDAHVAGNGDCTHAMLCRYFLGEGGQFVR
ncbi:hypothetical protein D3C76_866940 [compost metagenome]